MSSEEKTYTVVTILTPTGQQQQVVFEEEPSFNASGESIWFAGSYRGTHNLVRIQLANIAAYSYVHNATYADLVKAGLEKEEREG